MPGLRNMEPNVPEWAGKYPTAYGLLGATREAIQPMMRGGLADVALSRAVGYPTPEFMTEQEQMVMPALGMINNAAKWGKGESFLKTKMSPDKDLGYKEIPIHVKEKAIPEQRADYGLREKLQKLKDEGDIEQFRKLIYEDPLTGVLNRRAFDDVYPEAIKQGKNFASTDATGLKYVNDTYGHKAGDAFLKEFASSLKNEGVDLHRIGGDEFVAIFGKGDYWKLKRAAHNFSAKEIPITNLKGETVMLKGAKFDFGVGKTLESGDVALLKKRAGMEVSGKRAARGEKPVGLSEFTKEEALAELKRRGITINVKAEPAISGVAKEVPPTVEAAPIAKPESVVAPPVAPEPPKVKEPIVIEPEPPKKATKKGKWNKKTKKVEMEE